MFMKVITVSDVYDADRKKNQRRNFGLYSYSTKQTRLAEDQTLSLTLDKIVAICIDAIYLATCTIESSR